MCEVHRIEDLRQRVSQNFPDVEITEIPLGNRAFMSILRGGLGRPNAKSYMDAAVAEYVGHFMFNQFIDIHRDNPFIRVIIFGFNNIQGWTPFNQDRR